MIVITRLSHKSVHVCNLMFPVVYDIWMVSVYFSLWMYTHPCSTWCMYWRKCVCVCVCPVSSDHAEWWWKKLPAITPEGKSRALFLRLMRSQVCVSILFIFFFPESVEIYSICLYDSLFVFILNYTLNYSKN